MRMDEKQSQWICACACTQSAHAHKAIECEVCMQTEQLKVYRVCMHTKHSACRYTCACA